MARGNDAAAAQAELQKRLGVSANAEDMIETQKDAYPEELRRANAKGINVAATESLDPSSLDSKVDGTVIDHAVRGNSVVAVVENDDGRAYKVAFDLDDLGRAGSKAAKAGEDEKSSASTRGKAREGDAKK